MEDVHYYSTHRMLDTAALLYAELGLKDLSLEIRAMQRDVMRFWLESQNVTLKGMWPVLFHLETEIQDRMATERLLAETAGITPGSRLTLPYFEGYYGPIVVDRWNEIYTVGHEAIREGEVFLSVRLGDRIARLKAPSDGMITEAIVKYGDQIEPGNALCSFWQKRQGFDEHRISYATDFNEAYDTEFSANEKAIVVPPLKPSVQLAMISLWNNVEGEFVRRDHPLFDLSVDGVDLTVMSEVDGVVSKIFAHEGKIVKGGEVIGVISRRQ